VPKLSSAVLALNAIAIGSIGIAYLIDPNLLLAQYNIVSDNAGLDNMFRSAIGGLFLTMAIGFAWGVFKPQYQRHSLTLLALYSGGLALGRGVSMAMVGLHHPLLGFLFAYEVTATLLALWLLKKNAN
jgi:hypothetical protein